MLKSWLDDNLPGLVERIVKAEIERVSRGALAKSRPQRQPALIQPSVDRLKASLACKSCDIVRLTWRAPAAF